MEPEPVNQPEPAKPKLGIHSAPFREAPFTVVRIRNNDFFQDMERVKLAEVMKNGFYTLSCADFPQHSVDLHTTTLLGLKVVIELDHDYIHENFKEFGVAIHNAKVPTYELKASDAVDLLLEYEEFWIHSCSIVLPLTAIRTLRDTIVLSSYKCDLVNNNQSNMECTEVMFFVLVKDHIDDEGISNKEHLSNFLKESKENILKAHATCSKVTFNDDNPRYSHTVIRRS